MSLLLDALKKSGRIVSPSSDLSEMRLEDASVKKRPHPRIVPIALIASVLFAAGGGYYIYLEATPPDRHLLRDTASLSALPITARAPVSAAQTSAPLVPAQTQLEAAPEIAPPVASARKSVAPKILPRRAKASETNEKTLSILHQQAADSIDSILLSAYESYQKDDYASAWQRYREALAIAPDNRDALLGLGVIAQQQGKNDAAAHYYRQVLVLDPRDPIAYAGLSALGSGDPAGKESRLKQLISQQPDSAALYFALGHQYVEQSRWSDAQQAYFNALTMEPNNALFAFNLAISLDHLGQRKVAAQYYLQALQFDTTTHSRFNRTQAQQRLNELTALDN